MMDKSIYFLVKNKDVKNKHVFSLLFTVSLLSILFTSCRLPRYCDGFDLQNHKDIAFRNNDTITYFSDNLGTKDSLILCVSDFFFTEPYEFTEISIAPDYECCPEAYYQTNEIASVSIREHLIGCRDMEVQIGNDLYSFTLGYFDHIDTSTYTTGISVISFYVTINEEKLFCWKVSDTSGNRRFDSFTKMEYKGIVEFHDKQTGKIWKSELY
ncbi:MAG: hypothetical protein F082_2021 [bacterium F082]|nr:MAG: hypothetical protein F082_2021 [bacterium F082]KWW26570.1 MAG: hypothetical protein AUK64_2516 [bacterium P201]